MMKKIFFWLVLSIILVASIVNKISAPTPSGTELPLDYQFQAKPHKAGQLIKVKDFKVYDGDTADLILDRKVEPSIKARFLLIDTPEINRNVPYKLEARDRVIELFKQADLIQIEYEGAKKDKYGRDLVHIWVDGILLQEILTAEGLAIARYIHDYIPNSKYAEVIFSSQNYAKQNQLNVWRDGDADYLSKAEFSVEETVVEAPSNSPFQNVLYENCAAVKAADAAPIYPGDPGWNPKFDGNNNGIGCE